jgi:hypothetical protein
MQVWCHTGLARDFIYHYLKTNTMAKSSQGRNQDRSKVAGGQEYELQYEKEKTGASKEQIKKAIKTEGNQRKKVEEKLKK